MADMVLGPFLWERMIRAVEKVRERLLRTVAALEHAGIPYAVAGGNAVASWVSRVDESAVRNTPNVEILIRRTDLDRAVSALTAAGFVYWSTASNTQFLDGGSGKPRDAVRFFIAGENAGTEDFEAAPDVAMSELAKGFLVLNLEALVRMELAAFRTTNHVHLRDLIEVGLLDASWLDRLPPELARRLQELLDTPDG